MIWDKKNKKQKSSETNKQKSLKFHKNAFWEHEDVCLLYSSDYGMSFSVYYGVMAHTYNNQTLIPILF